MIQSPVRSPDIPCPSRQRHRARPGTCPCLHRPYRRRSLPARPHRLRMSSPAIYHLDIMKWRSLSKWEISPWTGWRWPIKRPMATGVNILMILRTSGLRRFGWHYAEFTIIDDWIADCEYQRTAESERCRRPNYCNVEGDLLDLELPCVNRATSVRIHGNTNMAPTNTEGFPVLAEVFRQTNR